jgi:hypothetical protein
MNTTLSVELIHSGEGSVPDVQSEVKSAAGPNRWSNAVESWVFEFQQPGRGEALPAFDGLFKDAPAQSQ